MGLTLKVSTGEAISNEFWMPMEDGQEGLFEVNANDLANDLEGKYLCGMLGYTNDFMMAGEFGEKPKVRLLFQVLDGEEKGKRFSLLFGYTLGAKAHLNHVLTAAGCEILPGEEFNLSDMYGKRVTLMLKSETNAKGYTNIYYLSCKPAEASQAKAAKSAPKAVLAPAPSFDPFAQPADTD